MASRRRRRRMPTGKSPELMANNRGNRKIGQIKYIIYAVKYD